jgi:hypothetical protein
MVLFVPIEDKQVESINHILYLFTEKHDVYCNNARLISCFF